MTLAVTGPWEVGEKTHRDRSSLDTASHDNTTPTATTNVDMRPSLQAMVRTTIKNDLAKPRQPLHCHYTHYSLALVIQSTHSGFTIFLFQRNENSVPGRVSSGKKVSLDSLLVCTLFPSLFTNLAIDAFPFVLDRFLGKDGKVYTGEPQAPLTWPKAVANLKSSAGDQTSLTAKVITGDIYSPSASSVTETVVPVAKLLSPLAYVPVFRCIGLNYAKHAEETKMPIPKYPILFMKPATSLQDPFKPVVIPSIAENNQADYECELAVVIGKKCKNVKEEHALDYVLGMYIFFSCLYCIVVLIFPAILLVQLLRHCADDIEFLHHIMVIVL